MQATRIILHKFHMSSFGDSLKTNKKNTFPRIASIKKNLSHSPTTRIDNHIPDLLNDIHHITVHVMTVESVNSHLSHEFPTWKSASFVRSRRDETSKSEKRTGGKKLVAVVVPAFGWDVCVCINIIPRRSICIIHVLIRIYISYPPVSESIWKQNVLSSILANLSQESTSGKSGPATSVPHEHLSKAPFCIAKCMLFKGWCSIEGKQCLGVVGSELLRDCAWNQ